MIDLTPLDVRKKKGDFRKGIRGYEVAEVDGFLDLVTERMDELVRENAQLRDRAAQLAQALEGFKGRDQAMNEALVSAQQLRESIRAQAERDAELTIREAKVEGERLLAEARREVERQREALRRAETQRDRFIRSYRSFLENQLGEVTLEEERVVRARTGELGGLMAMTEGSMVERISAAAEGIRAQVAMAPTVALSLGGGSDAGRYFARHAAVDLDPLLGAPEGGGTHGEMIFGELGGTPSVVLAGRAGGGTPLRESTLPVRLARQLGASALIIAGRAEILNPKWEKSRLMLIMDHINLLGANPLVGANDEKLGPRFPDMTEAYDSNFRRIAEESARDRGIQLVRGVYIGKAGVTASDDEAKLLSSFGGDAVGSGIVPEVITAVHGGMRVLGLAVLETRGAGSGASSTGGSGIGSSALEIIAAVVQRR